MNFLAHIYLSGDNPSIVVGNFIGDFVKGRNLTQQFGAEIAKGIELHRAIDEFTDTHAVVRQSKIRLRDGYGHYAPVIVDVFYDHFLARNWNDYNDLVLPDFAEKTYRTLEQFSAVLPDEVNRLLPFMIRGNWLVNYSKIEGIQRALAGMSRRTKFNSKMDESVHDLRLHYDEFKKEFDMFFPELMAFSQTFIAT